MAGASEPRPAASLSAGLLARRGAAQPAMRRAPLGGIASVTPSLDDLGWNDMGAEPPAPVSPISAAMVTEPVALAPPPVARQIAAIARRIGAPPPVAEPAPRARKAAFTLRLDSERHLRLRLLSALSHQSAQQLMVAALDRLLAEHGELEDMARRTKKARAETQD